MDQGRSRGPRNRRSRPRIRPSRKVKAADRGKPKIDDDWNAIRIIALSQANPLKAIAEFVENSIDARSKTITSRAAGVGLQLAAGRLGSIVGPLAVGQLLAARGESALAFQIAAAACALATLCYALVGALWPRQ